MATKMRKAVGHVTDVVFPPRKDIGKIETENFIKSGHDYVSNLPLQMTLYFNVFYFPIWLITACVMFEAKVPELAGSWLLSLLLQLPLILFLLLNPETIILPLERAVHIVMTVFVVFEVVLGYFAIRAMVNSQMTKFHLQQFYDIKKDDGFENRYTQ